MLINDWWLKSAYPNLITGKLSDFAGIAVVAFLLGALFPRRVLATALGIAAVFLWWKSPLSSTFIQLANDWLPFRIGRTVDYSDLTALCILPFCHCVLVDSKHYALPWRNAKRFLAAPILGISLFGILGTSQLPFDHETYLMRPTDPGARMDWGTVAEVIRTVAEEHNLACADEAVLPDCSYFQNDRIRMRYLIVEPNTVSFEISGEYTAFLVFFNIRSSEKEMDALRNSLKRAFASRFPEMKLEYVELLNQRYR
ncbi:MAG: hypothetical protein FWD67_07720 [Betaproteobacteria bacterium]|nr:hypothetical protein [Betaproteobacteria bacterium]